MMVGCKQMQVWLEPSSQGRHQPIDRNGGSAAAQTAGTQAVAADPAADVRVDVASLARNSISFNTSMSLQMF